MSFKILTQDGRGLLTQDGRNLVTKLSAAVVVLCNTANPTALYPEPRMYIYPPYPIPLNFFTFTPGPCLKYLNRYVIYDVEQFARNDATPIVAGVWFGHEDITVPNLPRPLPDLTETFPLTHSALPSPQTGYYILCVTANNDWTYSAV
jgi:hypothetical protein